MNNCGMPFDLHDITLTWSLDRATSLDECEFALYLHGQQPLAAINFNNLFYVNGDAVALYHTHNIGEDEILSEYGNPIDKTLFDELPDITAKQKYLYENFKSIKETLEYLVQNFLTGIFNVWFNVDYVPDANKGRLTIYDDLLMRQVKTKIKKEIL